MRGRSHGDWNRFHFSQILGAERVTMLLESRHPLRFVLQSTWTTPEEMLPGGVAFAVTASPGTVGGRAAHVGLGRSACTESPLPRTFTGMQAELARWFWHGGPGFSGLLLTPLAARPTALSRPRRAGLLLAL